MDFRVTLPSSGTQIYAFLQRSELVKNDILLKNEPILSYEFGNLLYLMGGGGSLDKDMPCFKYSTSVSATKIFEFINLSLKDHRSSLTIPGERYISTIVGEILDNAEIHSGDFCQWFVKTQFQKVGDSSVMNIALFNFGKTIYDNMLTLPKENEIGQWLRNKESQHKRNGLFRSGRWHKSNLYTFLSLQDGISHKYNPEISSDKGTGTRRLLDCFQKLTDEQNNDTSEICIFSGHSHIRIPSKYKIGQKVENGKTFQVLALNQNNSLSERPNYEYLNQFSNKNYFPGTLYSIKLKLNNQYVRENEK